MLEGCDRIGLKNNLLTQFVLTQFGWTVFSGRALFPMKKKGAFPF